VLALTDSLTLSSTAANLRLESFLYTEESLAEARDHLAPDGVLVIYNYYDQPFLIGKLAGMLNDVFGAPPIVRTYAGPRTPGAAFLLLETRNLATFSLLFGNTWTVNALVFAAILLSVLAAIGVSARWCIRGPIPYVLLAASLLANYLVPPATLLIDPPVLRYVLAATLAFLPVFFANLVFTASFRDTRTADMAFAS